MAELLPFRAWDGEGLGGDDGKPQRYALLASDDHPHLWNPEGIPTKDALAWIVELAASRKGHLIGFGTSYDVNMILGELPPQEVAALYLETDWEIELEGERWRLQWIPGKLFNIQHPDGRWARTWDSYGFFQCSFVGALLRWGLPVPEYLGEMKQRRGTFLSVQQWELLAYSKLECELLVQLMEKVRASLRHNGLKLRSWHGAGAIASAALRQAGAKSYLGRETRRPLIDDAILRAYFGGRTELFQQGEQAWATQYDINSAYASALRLLPDGRGEWRRSRSWEHDGRWAPWGLWRCSWDIDDEQEILAPFPFRMGRGINYPCRGEGWYHAAELKAGLRLYPEKIRVHTGYVFEPSTAERPFAFVSDLYALRKQLAAEGDPTATALKFGLASVWGKLSQATSRNGRIPTYQDYFWAGACTSLVRAWMLQLADLHRDRLIQISTDGLLLAGHERTVLDAKVGAGLGQLRRHRLQAVLLAQPGMMAAWESDTGEEINQTRGFFKREIDFEKLRAVWRAHGPRGALDTSGVRFVGIGTCMAQGSYQHWRCWRRQKASLSLHSSRKYYASLNGQVGGSYQLLPPFEISPGLSAPYEPKQLTIEALAEHLEWVQGTEQPLLAF